MIDADDLRAAVASGTVTEAQAAALVTLAERRQAGQQAMRPGEEPFELFRGFNEIFIVAGLFILATGWLGVWALIAGTSHGFGTTWAVANLATAAVMIALAEYFIRRRRMVAPAIALTIAWAGNALWFWSLRFESVTLLGGIDPEVIALPLALTALTIAAFWWRYRVPFAMALMAAATFAVLIALIGASAGRTATLQEMFLLSAGGPFALGTLIFGVALFALAMRFDMSDPLRLSLRSANGFWLHVIAAPAIVNTIALTLLNQGGLMALGLLTAVLLALAIVAIVIDRRSFLISAMGYVLAVISVVSVGAGTAFLILILGVVLVALGAGWQRARTRLVAHLPERTRNRLPPTA